MSIETSGPVAVQARIAAIHRMFAPSALGGVPSPTGTTRSTNQGAGDFAATLARLTSGAAGDPTGSGSGAVTGEQVVAGARKYLGVPYVWGGTDPAKGLDCSGLVQLVYKNLGIGLPRVSQDQARVGTEVPSLAQAKPGDLLVFGKAADHIGIYIGGNKMIVAPKAGDVVKVQDVYRTPSTIRRVLPESADLFARSLTSATSVGGSASSSSSSRAMAAAPAAYRTLFEQAGRRHGVSPDLLAAVAQTESGFNPRAVSSAGARGLMQIMPGTARGLGVDPTVPAQAVDGAARLLSQHQRSFGSTSLALAAYNAGPGAVSRYHGVPPYAETRSYVAKVLAAAGRSA
jgi:cell wall-associated NlpC family hydrolase